MTCVSEAFKDTDNCVEGIDIVSATTAPAPVVAEECALQPVPGNPQYFLNTNIKQFCGENMQFDVNVCTCIPITDDFGVLSFNHHCVEIS